MNLFQLELSKQLSCPLGILFRRTLDEGTVPDDWREVNVTPLYKKGNKSTPGNYRPVSLTSVVCKLLESIIKDAIMEHLEQHKLLEVSQRGFLPGRSCLTNLLAYLENVTKHVDSGLPVDTLYLDFAKVFDKVPRRRLLMKLKAHGIDGVVLEWIRRWLTDRKQQVIVNGETSYWLPVLSGVPQGSVLGPVLFLIYINDIDLNIYGEMLKFADDTKVICPIVNEEYGETLQTDLDRLMDGSNKWLMQFTIEKCKVMHFGYNNPCLEYTMGGEKLMMTESEKDLGVVIHSTLKPAAHITNCVNKANQMLGMIQRTITYSISEQLINREDGKPSGPAAELEESSLMVQQ